jgi:hypothetical protein
MGPTSLVEIDCMVSIRLSRVEDEEKFDATINAKDISSVRCFRRGVLSITNLSVTLHVGVYTNSHALHCRIRRAVGVSRLLRYCNLQTHQQLNVLATILIPSCCIKVYRATNPHAKTHLEGPTLVRNSKTVSHNSTANSAN